jgi:hypothetical protein
VKIPQLFSSRLKFGNFGVFHLYLIVELNHSVYCLWKSIERFKNLVSSVVIYEEFLACFPRGKIWNIYHVYILY